MRDSELQATDIRISGAQASRGTVRFGSSTESVTGKLGGKSFDVNLAKVKLSRVGAGEWPSPAALGRLLGRPPADVRSGGLSLAGLP